MAAKKDIEKKVKLREFQRSVNQVLGPEDRDYLFYALREYNTYKSVAKLMLALNSCLDSAEKLDLLPYIRDLIPKHDRKKFDSLAPYSRMAHPVTVEQEQDHSTNNLKRRENVRASTRVINLQRPQGTSLGFSIRGGSEHNLGIYLSHVDPLSLAEKSGLKVGDQIINVNGIDFSRVSHSSAVLVLKSHDNLKIEVKNTGILPASGQKMDGNSILWVDSDGNPVEDTDEAPQSPLLEKRQEEVSGGRLLTSTQHRKVVLHAQKSKELGFSVRGGQEYGLGIYISAVDSGSPAKEAGLEVGDQIMDVNGHSFVTIFHQEAVHILRSYQNIILTIKSLGRIPKLASEANKTPKAATQAVGTEANPTSPHTRKRTSSFLKSLKNKLSTHIEEEEEEEEEEEDEKQESAQTQARENSSDVQQRSRHAKVQRSHSMKTRSPDKRRPASTYATLDKFDLARSSNAPNEQKSVSAGSSPVLPRTFPRKPISISPLAIHEARAAAMPVASGPDGKITVTSKFFEKGVGTQVMLSSTTSSLAKELLYDKARRLLNNDDTDFLRDCTQQYEADRDVEAYAKFLISILDSPEKVNLLTEIRSIIHPSDIVHFDELVSTREFKVRQRPHSSDSDEESSEEDFNGVRQDDIPSEQSKRKAHHLNSGVIGNMAQSRFAGATETMSEPDLIRLRSKESSDLRWNGHEEDARLRSSTSALPSTSKAVETMDTVSSPGLSRNPVIVEVEKSSAYLGMSVDAFGKAGNQRIRVCNIREGGAIASDGFIQPGFEIVEVNSKRLRGRSQSDATHLLAEAFNRNQPTMTFIVIPNN